MNNTVLQLSVSDIDELIDLERKCFAYHWNREQFVMALERGVFRMMGIRYEGRLAGYIAFSLIEDEMEILNLAVSPDFRRMGLAAKMLARAFEICMKKGIVKSFLDVKESNLAAIALYQKFGYEQFGVRKKYYPDTNEDALLFRYDFVQNQYKIEEKGNL